jgi:LAS superfamily LD-carboxypeptidase LdcB
MASAAASMASAASVAAAASTGVTVTAPGTASASPEAMASVAAAVAAAAAAAGTDSADPDTPGEDGGARCPGNEQYAAEQPTGMRADVAAAWLAVAAAGESQGITMCLADGKRSRAQQQATYDDYVTQFGMAMADQYVLPPDKSAHVLGLAVDVQPYAAYSWLESTGGKLGFCRIYDNEAWHFEYDAAFPDDGCPARLPHPSA